MKDFSGKGKLFISAPSSMDSQKEKTSKKTDFEVILTVFSTLTLKKFRFQNRWWSLRWRNFRTIADKAFNFDFFESAKTKWILKQIFYKKRKNTPKGPPPK